jgi:hypothetical protein
MIGLRLWQDPDGLYRQPKATQLAVLAALRVESEPAEERSRSTLPVTKPGHIEGTQAAWDRLRAMEG